MPVSESQKKGGGLGSRFSDKAEHVPIKKRRFLFRSPSPPPEETVVPTKSEEITTTHAASKSAICEVNLSPNARNISTDVKKSDGKFGEDEDFSGISILAAAACSSSLGREYGYAEHGTAVEDSSVLDKPCAFSTSIKAGSLPKELLKEEFLSSSEMSTGGNLSCVSTEPVGELASISTAVNLPPVAESDIKCNKVVPMETGALESLGKASCRKDEEMVGIQRSSSREVKFRWDLNVVMDAWEEPQDDTGVHTVSHNQDAVKNKQNVDQRVLVDHATKPSTSGALNEADNTSVKTLSMNAEKSHHDQHDLVDDSRVFVSSTDGENVSTVTASATACDTISAENIALSKISQGLVPDGKNLPQLTVCTTAANNLKSCDSQFGETSKVNSSTCMKYSERDDNEERTEYNDDMHAELKIVTVAAPDVPGALAEDYDSQYEDGELRETTELAWEEYDDGGDREHEHVDYGSDDNGTCLAYPSDYHDSESGQVEGRTNDRQANESFGDCYVDNKVWKQASGVADDDMGNDKDNKHNLRYSSVEKMEDIRGTEQWENRKSSSDMDTDVIDDDGKKDRLSNADTLVDSKGTERRGEEPKVFRRPLQSRIEGPIFRDITSRDDRPFRTENRFESGSTRSFERGRYSYHNQGRGRHGGSWDGTSDYQRGYKRHYSPSNNRRSKLDDDDKFGCDGNRDELSYSRQLPNNRTSAVEEPCAGLQSRYRSDRKFSPDRGVDFGRGRPFRYNGPFDDSRGGRGRGRGRGRYNNRPSPDESFQSSLKYRRPLSRRERSFSPFVGRGQSNINHSRGKSPSRSRSRSPIVWDSPRERPGVGRGARTFVRHRSRSPNFRSPNQQPVFRDGHAGGFRSLARTHSSPPRNRWTSDRRDETGNFRDFGYKQRTTPLERSPDRFRSRGDRDSYLGSPRNLKSDSYCRFSDRISEDGSGRGLRCADNYEERRKPSNFIRPARRDYGDMDDGFSNNNNNNNRNRDAPRFRGRGGFRGGIDSRIGDMRRRFQGDQQSKDHMGRYNDNMGGTNQGNRYNYEDRRKQYGTSNFMRGTDNESKEERLNQNADENFQDAPDFSVNAGDSRNSLATYQQG